MQARLRELLSLQLKPAKYLKACAKSKRRNWVRAVDDKSLCGTCIAWYVPAYIQRAGRSAIHLVRERLFTCRGLLRREGNHR